MFHPGYEPVSGVIGHRAGDTWEWTLAIVKIVLDSSLSHVSIATSFGRSGLDGSPASRQAWNLDQSVLKSRRSKGFRKDDQYRMLISIGK